jgi:SpoVK/Ycf46/Vps4 family AAA+-type ATPase
VDKWFIYCSIFLMFVHLPLHLLPFLQVDSLLGRRQSSGEHESMRKMKNEFMINWDGLRTKERERVLVLGATNRPFDIDEAVIRRFPRR